MLNCVCISQAALTQLIQYYHRFQKILSQHPFKRLPIRSELINIHHVMVEVKKHKTTFWMIEEWTFVTWPVVFPLQTTCYFLGKCSSIHLKIIHFYRQDYLKLWKQEFSRVSLHVLRWGNKPQELKTSISTASRGLVGFRCRTIQICLPYWS